MKIGYAPYSRDLNHPGDQRRFPYYAKRRGIHFDLADPSEHYDLVVVTARGDLQRWSKYPAGARVVYDMPDSYLAIPGHSPKALLRGTAKFVAGEAGSPFYSYHHAIERMLDRANGVVCASPEQADEVSRLCDNVHPILDFHGELVRSLKTDYSAGRPFNLVWEGLGNNVRWLRELAEPLAALDRRHPIALHVITELEYREFVQRFWRRSAVRIAAPVHRDVRLYQWSSEMVSVIATACDLAVIPLPLDRPFESHKPETKLIALWRMGLPVVASATPAYVRTMDAAGLPLYCRTSAEWIEHVRRLIEDDEMRRDAAERGRAFADSTHSEERQLRAWDRVMESVGFLPQ
jgi:hypothetical protein